MILNCFETPYLDEISECLKFLAHCLLLMIFVMSSIFLILSFLNYSQFFISVNSSGLFFYVETYTKGSLLEYNQ